MSAGSIITLAASILLIAVLSALWYRNNRNAISIKQGIPAGKAGEEQPEEEQSRIERE